MSNSSEYLPPTVWEWETKNGGEFEKVNRPISGKTHEEILPLG